MTPQVETIPGIITHFRGGFYQVQTSTGEMTCRLRGRFKLERADTDFIAIGDRVEISLLQDGSGVIEVVKPRHTALVRLDPRPRGVFQQVMLANCDLVLIVFACTEPDPNLRMLDRFLIIAERQGIPPLIVANKLDLVDEEDAADYFSIYTSLGYEVLFTSTVDGTGIENLRQHLRGKISALVGPSGVGKTSLINALDPNLQERVGLVNPKSTRGRHTTVARRVFILEGDSYVADLPGLRSLAIWDIEPEELDGYFPEMRPLVQKCQFNDCTHQNESGCAIIKAVKKGKISVERYESYLRLRFGRAFEEETELPPLPD